MNNTFNFVGRISLGKETDKFKPYEETTYDSGWVMRKLKFNVLSGTNRNFVEISGGHGKDLSTQKVFTFSKTIHNGDGSKTKGEKLEIKWEDRNKQSEIDKVAEFKKFVIDTEAPGRRWALEKLCEDIKDGKDVSEQMDQLGVKDASEAKAALEASNKKKHVYITEWDFAEAVYKLLKNPKIKNTKFKIIGDVQFTENNGRFYRHLNVRRIYLAGEEDVDSVEANICIYYNKDSLDSASVEEKGKYYINAFVRDYDSQRKNNIGIPIQIALDANNKGIKIYKKRFTVDDDKWYECGIKVDMIDGAQKMELDVSVLDEDTQELLLLGEITEEDIIKDMGGEIYGDRVTECLFKGYAVGYVRGSVETVYLDDDFKLSPVGENSDDNVDESSDVVEDSDDEDNLFDDIDI